MGVDVAEEQDRDGRADARRQAPGALECRHACATNWPRRGICTLLPIYAKPLHRLIRELAPPRMVLKAIVRKGCQQYVMSSRHVVTARVFWYLAGLIGSGVIAARQVLALLVGVRVLSPERLVSLPHAVAPSSRGLGRRPLKAVTPVQIWSGLRKTARSSLIRRG